jgi:hypothetical protein
MLARSPMAEPEAAVSRANVVDAFGDGALPRAAVGRRGHPGTLAHLAARPANGEPGMPTIGAGGESRR